MKKHVSGSETVRRHTCRRPQHYGRWPTHRARELALSSGVDDHATILERLAWQAPDRSRPSGYVELLDRCRQSLSGSTAEILELRHARHLDEIEIAYVLAKPLPEVESALAEGTDSIERLLQEYPDAEVSPAELVTEVFSPAGEVVSAPGPPELERAPLRLREGMWIADRFQIVSPGPARASWSTFLVSDRRIPGEGVTLHVSADPFASPAARNGVLRKLEQLKMVVDPAIERILSHGWILDHLWYVTPNYRGETLEEVCAGRPLTLEEAREVLVPIWRGVASLHGRGIVHREISPTMIWLVHPDANGVNGTLSILVGAHPWLSGAIHPEEVSRWTAPEISARMSDTAKAGEPSPSEDVYALALTTASVLSPGVAKGVEAGGAIELPKDLVLDGLRPALEAALGADPAGRPAASDLAAKLAIVGDTAKRQRRQRLRNTGLAIGLLAALVLGFVYVVKEARRELIEESLPSIEAQVLERELAAERERTRALEQRLEGMDKAEERGPEP